LTYGIRNDFETWPDRFHSGTYWPSHVIHDVDRTKVLDIAVTEGWANPYQVFPDPELLAKAQ
jgi:hypothetical protein